MKIFYLYNEKIREEVNEKGYDYSPAYFKALFAFMGVSATGVSTDELSIVTSDDILFVGAERVDKLPDCSVILLGASIGADCVPSERVEKVFAQLELKNGRTVPLFVPIKNAQTVGDEVLCFAVSDGEKVPALVKSGKAYEFCFDLLASVWFSGDGYQPSAPSDYFPKGRTPDFRPLKSELTCDAFNDFLIEEVEDILRELGAPTLYRMPQKDGRVPDMAIHFSGDDDCTSAQVNLQAAENMHEFGFPYHINAMAQDGQAFIFDKTVYEQLNALGCEVALHSDFYKTYSFEMLRHQVELFKNQFGAHPFTNTNHCFIQDNSTADRMRWFAQCGIVADNGKIGSFDPNNINAFDLYSFGFGTAFPRFTCDDASHGNSEIDAIEIPITYYEPRLFGDDADTSKIRSCIDSANEQGRIIQFFIHPHYLSYYYKEKIQATLNVLRFIKEYTARYDALFTTTNEITRFWFARSVSTLAKENEVISVDAKTPLSVVLPREFTGKKITVDGVETQPVIKVKNGKPLNLVCVSEGVHTISCE